MQITSICEEKKQEKAQNKDKPQKAKDDKAKASQEKAERPKTAEEKKESKLKKEAKEKRDMWLLRSMADESSDHEGEEDQLSSSHTSVSSSSEDQ